MRQNVNCCATSARAELDLIHEQLLFLGSQEYLRAGFQVQQLEALVADIDLHEVAPCGDQLDFDLRVRSTSLEPRK
jgi:hypothetical protein